MHRIFIIIVVCCMSSFGQADSHKKYMDIAPMDPMELVRGSPNAPITLINYFSLSCGACALFELKYMPKIVQEYVDTGKVRVVSRHFPVHGAFDIEAVMIAHCDNTAEDRIGRFFKDQAVWIKGADILTSMEEFAKKEFGMSTARINVCKNMQQRRRTLFSKRRAAAARGVDATPFFILTGGKKETQISGLLPYKEFKKTLDSYIEEAT